MDVLYAVNNEVDPLTMFTNKKAVSLVVQKCSQTLANGLRFSDAMAAPIFGTDRALSSPDGFKSVNIVINIFSYADS